MITMTAQPARLTCAYYRNRFDGTLWALRADGVRVLKAIGPLPPHFAQVYLPMEHRAEKPVEVAGWNLLAFDLVGDLWELHRKNRIAPGFSYPRAGRADLQEYQGEFEITLQPA